LVEKAVYGEEKIRFRVKADERRGLRDLSPLPGKTHPPRALYANGEFITERKDFTAKIGILLGDRFNFGLYGALSLEGRSTPNKSNKNCFL
jgi:hypothetical protein